MDGLRSLPGSLRGWLAAKFLSDTGSALNLIVLGTYALEVMASAAALGVLLALRLRGTVLGGAIAPRLAKVRGNRAVMIAADFLSAALILTLVVTPEAFHAAWLFPLVALLGACHGAFHVALPLLSKPHMFDETAAFDYVEAMLWPNGPACPHCGNKERIYKLEGVRSKPSKKNPEGVERHGLKKCGACCKQFTVRKGTILEKSHIPLHKWLQALALMASSKKGISANQLHRTLEITLKSAWFLAHRIREAMRSGSFDPMRWCRRSGQVHKLLPL